MTATSGNGSSGGKDFEVWSVRICCRTVVSDGSSQLLTWTIHPTSNKFRGTFLQALHMLSDPSNVPVAALGVFAITQVGFDSGLEALDLDDHDAVLEAAVALVNRIASAENDDDLRSAASTILQRQN